MDDEIDLNIAPIVKFNSLKQNLLYINLQKKKQIKIEKEKELEEKEKKVNRILSLTGTFKRKLYKFVLANELSNNLYFISRMNVKRKEITNSLKDEILELRSEIENLEDEIRELEIKIKKIKRKIEKLNSIEGMLNTL